MKSILIASDHGGYKLKEKIKLFLKNKRFTVKDLGPYNEERCDYPKYASNLAQEISKGNYQKGILICKTGIGNSIVANRFPSVRAALCYNLKSAKLSREHNDSNILVLGSLFVSLPLAKRMISLWLSAGFKGGRHKKRLNQIRDIEKNIKEK
ncbi:MAG: ribose 5-phosphate isomerase B [Candidatus Omnitrophota bacterium]